MTTTRQITIYVRHSAGCKNEGDEFARRCDCRNWIRWTQDGTRHRRKADTRSWAEAERVKRDLEDQLTGHAAPAGPETKNLRAAAEVFLADKKVQGITADVIAKYKRELGRLASYCEAQGVYTVTGLTKPMLTGYASTFEEQYRSTQTRAAVRSRTTGFLRYCHEAQWIPRIPTITKIQVFEAPTLPLSKDEYARLLAAADKFVGPAAPAHVRALIELMRWRAWLLGTPSRCRKPRLSSLGTDTA